MNNLVLAKPLFLSIYICFEVFASLTEKDVIEIALKRNPAIQIIRIEKRLDSLTLQQLKAQKLPQITLSASPYIIPFDSQKNVTDPLTTTSLQKAGGDGTISVYQNIFTGASFSGEYKQGLSLSKTSDSTLWTSSILLSATQPLLRGAFGHNVLDYELKIAGLNNKNVELNGKKKVLEQISNIRGLFWNYYLNRRLTKFTEQELEFACRQRKAAQQRFALGEVAQIDTLSAIIEELKVRKTLITENAALYEARNNLANALMISPDSINIVDSLNQDIILLPAPAELVSMARKNNPDIEIFQVLRDKIELQISQARNTCLPSLAAQAAWSMERNGDSYFSDHASMINNVVLSLIFSYDLPSKPYKTDVKKALLQKESNEISLKAREQEVISQLQVFLQNWEREKAKLDLAQVTIQLATRQFSTAQQGYELGSIGRLELLKAQNDLRSAEIDYIQNLIEMKRVEIVIEEITGIVLNRFGLQMK